MLHKLRKNNNIMKLKNQLLIGILVSLPTYFLYYFILPPEVGTNHIITTCISWIKITMAALIATAVVHYMFLQNKPKPVFIYTFIGVTILFLLVYSVEYWLGS